MLLYVSFSWSIFSQVIFEEAVSNVLQAIYKSYLSFLDSIVPGEAEVAFLTLGIHYDL